MRIYADHNATTPILPAAKEVFVASLETAGNASSAHQEGRAARALIETSRARVARALGCQPGSVVFCSGASEALDLAVRGAARAGVRRAVIGATEHPAVQAAVAQLPEVQVVAVDASGLVRAEALAAYLAPGTLVVIQAANSETGVIQPIGALAALVHRAGAMLLVDASQAWARIDGAQFSDADGLVISGHKIGAGPGVGVLRLGPMFAFAPAQVGGGQEDGRRPGTENAPAIAAFAHVVGNLPDLSFAYEARAGFEAAVADLLPGAHIVGADGPRLGNTSCVILPGLESATVVMAMDLAGVAISAGSACGSGKVRRSTVLEAMGHSADMAACAVRVSFGWSSHAHEGKRVAEALNMVATRVRPTRSGAFAEGVS